MTSGTRDVDGARWAGGAPGLVLAAVLGALAAACSVGLLATAAWLISRSAQRPPVLFLMAPAAVVQAFGLGRALLRYAERLAGHNAALGLLAARRVRAYDALARLAPAGLAEYRSGDLIARLVTDIDSFADRWLRVRLPFVAATVAGAGAVALVTALQPAAGLVLGATLVVSALAGPAVAIALSRREERSLAPLRGELAASTMELLEGAAELTAFGAAGRALAGVQSNGRRVGEATARSGYGRGAGAAVGALATGAALLGAMFFAVPAVRSGALAGVLLAVVVLTPLAAHEVFAGLGPAAQEIPGLRAADGRVAQLLARPAPVTEPVAPVPLPTPPYRLAARGLTVGWTPGEPVLRDVSFDVPAGSRVAIVGPSGSGKTTLAMVLLRFLDYGTGESGQAGEGGTVTLNGTDLHAFAGDELREVIGLCEQDAHVFDSTLEANLRLAKPEAAEEELRDALARARLLAWTDSLPLGLHTPVGEHGARLSGGQRQRLALARVLLADFPVVILDEPAEHLDEETADELTRDLLTAVAGRTVLLITHRPVDPGSVDQVLRLGDGRLTADADLTRLRG
ncbi:MAG: thiol reductant ABC exporter subunit CydC [Trebonia sp.]|jgi:ATP-binding cassette subfamily C protein CydC